MGTERVKNDFVFTILPILVLHSVLPLQTIPYCPVCPSGDLGGERGIMKPDIVFFGEGLSDEFHDCMNADKQTADLLIVIGSSLKVRPVAMIPSEYSSITHSPPNINVEDLSPSFL